MMFAFEHGFPGDSGRCPTTALLSHHKASPVWRNTLSDVPYGEFSLSTSPLLDGARLMALRKLKGFIRPAGAWSINVYWQVSSNISASFWVHSRWATVSAVPVNHSTARVVHKTTGRRIRRTTRLSEHHQHPRSHKPQEIQRQMPPLDLWASCNNSRPSPPFSSVALPGPPSRPYPFL